MERYFNRKLSEQDEINKSILDPSRKSYRKKFKEYIEEQLDFILIEETIYETTE